MNFNSKSMRRLPVCLIFQNNNGQLQPNETLIDQNLMNQMYNAELFDINDDGFIDLIVTSSYNLTCYLSFDIALFVIKK